MTNREVVMADQAIGDRFRQLTLKGSEDYLTKEEQIEWLTYYSLAIDHPNHLAEETAAKIGVTMSQWVDFCLLNIGYIARLRDRPIDTGFQDVWTQ